MPEYKDAESSDHPEVPVTGVICDEKTHNKPEYVRTMDKDVENID